MIVISELFETCFIVTLLKIYLFLFMWIRGVPIHRYRPVSAIFASIGIGKMNPILADTADTFIFIYLYVKWKYTNYINIFYLS